MSLFSVSLFDLALQSIILISDTLCSAGEPKQAWLYLGACQEQENFRSVPLDDELSVTTSRKCSKILTQNDSDINDGSGDHNGNQTSRVVTLREEKRKTKRQNMINVNLRSRWKIEFGWRSSRQHLISDSRLQKECSSFPLLKPPACLHVLWNTLREEHLVPHPVRIRIGLPSNSLKHGSE